MRKKINNAIFLICLLVVFTLCNKITEAEENTLQAENLYIIETMITDFVESTDTVITQAESGKLYTFNGIEDWEISDRCILVFDDNGTETLNDDKIIRTFYRR